MNAKEKWSAALLAAQIEFHWWMILRCRRRGERWIGSGEPLSSKRLLRLNERINRHGVIAKAYEREYEERFVSRRT